eukprot:3501405-Amphidinium_carterae.1
MGHVKTHRIRVKAKNSRSDRSSVTRSLAVCSDSFCFSECGKYCKPGMTWYVFMMESLNDSLADIDSSS